MTDDEINAAVQGQPHLVLAVASLAKMFREGLNDALALPEVQSDADRATHKLLGCEKHLNVYLLASLVNDVKNNETPMTAQLYLERLLQIELLRMANQVTMNRGPIGETLCQ